VISSTEETFMRKKIIMSKKEEVRIREECRDLKG
jgi:hypothetical protein